MLTELSTFSMGTSYQLALTKPPTGNVVIDTMAIATRTELQSYDVRISLLSSSVTFTPFNWNSIQTVFISGIPNSVVEGNNLKIFPPVLTSLSNIPSNFLFFCYFYLIIVHIFILLCFHNFFDL
jgi:hypothetical protein